MILSLRVKGQLETFFLSSAAVWRRMIRVVKTVLDVCLSFLRHDGVLRIVP